MQRGLHYMQRGKNQNPANHVTRQNSRKTLKIHGFREFREFVIFFLALQVSNRMK